MKLTPGAVEGAHIVMTGPIQGVVELEDGTVVDVSPSFIEVSDEQAAEVAEKIGLRYQEEGHPDDVEVDPETGQAVQRQFVYVADPEAALAEAEAQRQDGTGA